MLGNDEANSGIFNHTAIESYRANQNYGSVTLNLGGIYFFSLSCLTILLLIILFVSFNIKIARNVTATGSIVSPEGAIHVFGPPGKTLAKINVRNGEWVEKNAVLARMADSHYLKDDREMIHLLTGHHEYHMEILQKRAIQIDDEYEHKTIDLQEKISTLKSEIVLIEEEMQIYHTREAQSSSFLIKIKNGNSAAISGYEQKQMFDEDLQLKAAIKEKERELLAHKYDLSNALSQLKMLPLRHTESSLTINREILAINEKILSLESRGSQLIRSPVQGYVENFNLKQGEMINELPVLSLLPSKNRFEIEAFLPAKYSGFIEIGQSVNILVDAFPYHKFGFKRGKVKYLSEAVSDYAQVDEPAYRILVSLDEPYILHNNQQHGFKYGMTVKLNIRLEDRTIAEWFLEPLLKIGARLN